MRRYFDQKFKTRFSKQTMSKEVDFQWVIEEMENEFEYPKSDINTFDDFFTVLVNYDLHVNYFIRIYEIDKQKLNINNEFVNLLSNIAKFARKEIPLNDILKNNKYQNFTILYTLGIIAGFVQKSKTAGTYDFSMFVYYNWFELHQIKNMPKKYQKCINKLLAKLNILEKSKIQDIYSKNFKEIVEPYNTSNLKCLNDYNKMFSGYGYKRNQFCTWQENYLLDMSKLHSSISEIIPTFSSYNWKFPNCDLWNKKILDNMKNFFKDNNDALFVLDIIDYRLNDKILRLDTQRIVFNQILKIIKNKTNVYEFDNVWFYILVKCMKEKNSFIRNNINQIYIALRKKRNIQIVLFLKENGFIINKELQQRIDRFYINRIKTIEKIEELSDFNDLLTDKYIIKNINFDMINNIKEIFHKLIKMQDSNLQVSSCFYNMIILLIESKLILNNDLIDTYIFEILNLWHEKYYEKMKALLHMYTYTTKIKTVELEKYNEYFLENPLVVLRHCFTWSEENIVNKMAEISEHALVAKLKSNTIYISEFIPYYKEIDLKQTNSLENLISQYLENVQIKYEEQLLNPNMMPIEYLYSMYESYKLILTNFINAIDENSYKIMYNNIKDSFLKYKLLAYPKEIKMAYITQLIPLLEILIRELGIKNNVIPFKEKKNQIHVMKDSSTILLAIIKKKYKKNRNFEELEIYMFLYNYLYNVNSLNLRNELIHAREYLENDSQMTFAFRVLIIGIFWALIELYI